MTDDDLERRVAELEDALRGLRTEVRRPPRGPLGLPRPPTPGELARAADEHAIPAAIASLEAAIHALELLRLGLRAANPERRRLGGRSERPRSETAERVGRAALDRLDRALDDAVDALEGTPTDPESREVLAEARRLREEIAERVEKADADTERTDEEAADESKTDAGPEVDVESELQSIKDEQNED